MFRWCDYRYLSVCQWLTVYHLWYVSVWIYVITDIFVSLSSLLHVFYYYIPLIILQYVASIKLCCAYLMILCLWLFTLVTDLSLCLLLLICVSHCTATVMCLQFYLRWCQVVKIVNINMSTSLMLSCPNYKRISQVPAYLHWSCCSKSFLIMCLLYSHLSFIVCVLLPFCLVVSLCSKFMCLGGCIVWAFVIVSFLSILFT